MQEFKQLSTSDLIDMLAHHAARYSAMQAEGSSIKEYYSCRLIIQFLQKEIELRKKTGIPGLRTSTTDNNSNRHSTS